MSLKPLRKLKAEAVTTWKAPAMFAEDVVREATDAPPEGAEAETPATEEEALEAVAEMPIPTAEEIEQWRAEAEQEGYAEGQRKAQAELQPLREQLQASLDFLQAPVLQLESEVQQQLAHLAVILAQQLLRRELRTDPGEIVGLVRDSLKLLPAAARDVRVHVHPEDARLLRQAFSSEEQSEDENSFLYTLVEDSSISRGGCDIRAHQSRIDASVENRLSRMAAAVLGGDRQGDASAQPTEPPQASHEQPHAGVDQEAASAEAKDRHSETPTETPPMDANSVEDGHHD